MANPPGPPTPPNQPTAPLRPVYGTTLAVVLLLAVIIPATVTLSTVREAIVHFDTFNSTPYGYTVSLLMYLAPVATLLGWFYRAHPRDSFRRRAFHWTLILLVPIGFALDIAFGNLFFQFPNPDATLKIFLPGYSIDKGEWVRDIPIEEFIFYASGFFAILLLYIWNNEVWVAAYGIADYGDTSKHPPYVIQPHWQSLWWGAAFFAAAVIYKKNFAPIVPERNYQEGFPLYFLFLLIASVVPSLLLYRTAKPFVNWRAFSITLLWVLLTSLLWEATLASPYGWWHYHYRWMMGLHIKAWASLPVEAVILWLVVSQTTILVYETIKVYIHMRVVTTVPFMTLQPMQPAHQPNPPNPPPPTAA